MCTIEKVELEKEIEFEGLEFNPSFKQFTRITVTLEEYNQIHSLV